MTEQLEIRTAAYTDPDAQLLVAQVQQEYIRRYGSPDEGPLNPAEFAVPAGLFVVGYLDGQPVAMGGWRRCVPERADSPWAIGGAAEVKRMYVSPAGRGRGFARAVLAHLESSARAAGLGWVILETGTQQPEAIALYESTGYGPVPPFGHYACAPQSIHLGKEIWPEASSLRM